MKLKLFIEKYTKQIIIVAFILFSLKSFQSCNRQMTIKSKEKQLTELKDSLNLIISSNKDTISVLKQQLEMANVYKDAANTRAEAVQSVAEKIIKNTTVKVEK